MKEPSRGTQEAYLTTAMAVVMGIDSIPYSCPVIGSDGSFDVDSPQILQTGVPGKTALKLSEAEGTNIFTLLNTKRTEDIQQLLIFLMLINAYDNHGDNIMIEGDRVGAVDFENGFQPTGLATLEGEMPVRGQRPKYIIFDSVLMGTKAFKQTATPAVKEWGVKHLSSNYFLSALENVTLLDVGNPFHNMPRENKTALIKRAQTIHQGLVDGKTIKDIARELYPVSVAVIEALESRCSDGLTHQVYAMRNQPVNNFFMLTGVDESCKNNLREALKEQRTTEIPIWCSDSDEEAFTLEPPDHVAPPPTADQVELGSLAEFGTQYLLDEVELDAGGPFLEGLFEFDKADDDSDKHSVSSDGSTTSTNSTSSSGTSSSGVSSGSSSDSDASSDASVESDTDDEDDE
jgi:hypothetical protein